MEDSIPALFGRDVGAAQGSELVERPCRLDQNSARPGAEAPEGSYRRDNARRQRALEPAMERGMDVRAIVRRRVESWNESGLVVPSSEAD